MEEKQKFRYTDLELAHLLPLNHFEKIDYVVNLTISQCLGMARRHWLDPLARQLLLLSGHLPRGKVFTNPLSNHRKKVIELELEALKGKQQLSKINTDSKVDVNRAKASDWRNLPGCTEEMVELLQRLQRGGVQLSRSEDLFQLLELPDQLAEAWRPFLIFRWYGDPPPLEAVPLLDINAADISTLKKNLNWPEERFDRLIRERQKNSFKDLADLQERLTLPAFAIEKLIGIVRFGSKPAGPTLPPGC